MPQLNFLDFLQLIIQRGIFILPTMCYFFGKVNIVLKILEDNRKFGGNVSKFSTEREFRVDIHCGNIIIKEISICENLFKLKLTSAGVHSDYSISYFIN